MEKKFLSEIASILEMPQHEANANTVLSEHAWDSLSWLEAATLMESEYNHQPTMQDIQRCHSISDLWTLIQKDALALK